MPTGLAGTVLVALVSADATGAPQVAAPANASAVLRLVVVRSAEIALGSAPSLRAAAAPAGGPSANSTVVIRGAGFTAPLACGFLAPGATDRARPLKRPARVAPSDLCSRQTELPRLDRQA